MIDLKQRSGSISVCAECAHKTGGSTATFWLLLADSVEKLNEPELSHSPCSIPTLQNAIYSAIVPSVRVRVPPEHCTESWPASFSTE